MHAKAFGCGRLLRPGVGLVALPTRHSPGRSTARDGAALVGFVDVVCDGLVPSACGLTPTLPRVSTMPNPQVLETLGRARYARLTTFKKDGTAVPTPVWLVRDGDHLLVITGADTGKVKRLRHTPRVLLAPSDYRGRVDDGVADVEGTAELVTDGAELGRLEGLLKDRYGLRYRVAALVNKVQGRSLSTGAEIRISL